MVQSLYLPTEALRIREQLSRDRIAQQEEETAQSHCKQLLEDDGDGAELSQAFNDHLATAVFVGHKNCQSYELSRSTVRLFVASSDWRQNLNPAMCVENALEYTFEYGCVAERYRGWSRKMVVIDRLNPKRKLNLEWRSGINAWFVMSSPGWRESGSARLHGNSQRFIPGRR